MQHRVLLVGITGGSGSGKSTLAEALVSRLGADRAVLFHEDAYYWPQAYYGSRPDGEIDYDDPRSKDVRHLGEDLATLRAGTAIEQPIYDYDAHDRTNGHVRRLEPRPIIVIEGIHVLSLPAIRAFVDLAAYIDTPDDVRLARRVRRDVLGRGRSVEGVLSQYLRTVRPAHYAHTYPAKFTADLVLADEGSAATARDTPGPADIERLLAPILARLDVLLAGR